VILPCDALLAGDSDEAARACADHLAQSVRTILRTGFRGAGDTELNNLDLLA
jgi:DNA-binding GntR family transcriptional regulator